ncbi:MAG: methylmalonyl Co-A mutase-associated GTPase MeaB [Actinomycetota bacterium]
MARTKRSVDELYTEAKQGRRLALGRLLTMVERGGDPAERISDLTIPDAGAAHVVGITGAPGAGKSTLTGRLVADLLTAGRRPAVLAVDPSSPLTGGAILGDRIRMDESAPAATRFAPPADASAAEQVTESPFIRSMATRGHSGGLALAVPLAVRLFDAMGYDPVIIETVGVGQVEVDVVGAADTAVVVMTPGMGDAVQANKAGLLEVADVFVVNKADRPGANDVRRDLELMLDLSHMTGQEDEEGYRPPIVMSSALEGQGSEEVWKTVEDHLAFLDQTGRRQVRRRHRITVEIRARADQTLGSRLDDAMQSDVGIDLIGRVERGELSPSAASNHLLRQLSGS